ncbi:MAG: four-carbon acid sugar kinase family protein [Pseudomonadota bacterium]
MNRKTRLLNAGIRIVVLDDDPTGIQTVHGCLVLTEWSGPNIVAALKDDEPYFFILTNTRAFAPEKAREIIAEITRQVVQANLAYGYRLVFICRSDSTLRGHFPLEMDTVIETAGIRPEARFLIPAFFEGKRVTTGDVHYIVEGKTMIPCHETEFARDTAFGYATAHLPGYVEEKTNGRIHRDEIISLSQKLLQKDAQSELALFLDAVPPGRFVVVNATGYAELDRFSDAIVTRLEGCAVTIFQSAASFVKSLVACPVAAPVGSGAKPHGGPGLIVVGSHVEKTTRQLNALLAAPGLEAIKIDVSALLKNENALSTATSKALHEAFKAGSTPVVFTSRTLWQSTGNAAQLESGRRISAFLSMVVATAKTAPSFLIAKGGITAHDILTSGLGIARARVLGQAAPGVPVIRMPPGHRWAGMPYVIFPGNVGEDDALKRVYLSLAN